MVDFSNIVRFTAFFQKSLISREIHDLQTFNPGAKNLPNFLKKRFMTSESSFELFMTHREMHHIFK